MLVLEILIPTVWVLVVAIVVAACSVSARGDSRETAVPEVGDWIEVGGLRLSAPELLAQGGPGQSQGSDPLVRELGLA